MGLLARLGVQKKRGYTNAKSIAKKKIAAFVDWYSL
jgi:hypothetical protein